MCVCVCVCVCVVGYREITRNKNERESDGEEKKERERERERERVLSNWIALRGSGKPTCPPLNRSTYSHVNANRASRRVIEMEATESPISFFFFSFLFFSSTYSSKAGIVSAFFFLLSPRMDLVLPEKVLALKHVFPSRSFSTSLFYIRPSNVLCVRNHILPQYISYVFTLFNLFFNADHPNIQC